MSTIEELQNLDELKDKEGSDVLKELLIKMNEIDTR